MISAMTETGNVPSGGTCRTLVVQRLRDKEHAVRQATAKTAGYTSVRWTAADDGAGHTLLRLLTND